MSQEKAGTIKNYIIKNRKTVVHITTVLLIIWTSILTVKYNLQTDSIGPIDTFQSWLIFAFKYIPTMILAATCGSVPFAISTLILFLVKIIRFSSFSYTSVIYLIVGLTVYFPAKMKHLKSKRLTFVALLFTALIAGPFWGGVLGAIGGQGWTEFMPQKGIFYFLNETVECTLGYIIIYLFLNKAPDWVLECFPLASSYSKRIEEEEESATYKNKGMSKLGRVVTNLIITEAVFLGIMAAIYSNTLIPGMRQADYTEQEIEELNLQPWENITNTVALEKQVSTIISVYDTGGIQDAFTSNRGIIAYDTKLGLLILMLIIPSAILVNKYAEWRITRPIIEMADAVKRFNTGSHADKDLNEDLKRVKDLNIHTKDEIEDLYNAFSDTFSETVAYIEYMNKQRDLERDLEIANRANEAKTIFLSNMSHEIRTPINAVLGFDEMIIRESVDPSITEHAREIQSSGKTLLSLINDILDFSRIESGRMDIIPVEYDLTSMANDLINMVGVRARDKGLALELSIDENTPHVLVGDEMRLRQCALNILNNAVKYTNEGSVIFDLSFEKIDDDRINLRFTVSDTGQGIKTEDLERLFKPFERIDEENNRTIEGTGLGMSIVKRLLDLMGSHLEVKSEFQKGSTFSFAVEQGVASWEPIGKFSDQYEESLSRVVSYEESFHAPDAHILVVDDTRTNLTVVKGLLRENLIQIDTAENGPDALNLCKENKYDMIFLDHRMPEMDGIETFHHLREDKGGINFETPVVVLTANAIAGAREKYMKEGFSDYLTKPVESAKLESVLLAYIPPEKIYRRGEESFVEQNKDLSEEKKLSADAYQRVVKVTGIDLQKGIDNCGGPELLLEVLRDFCLSIDDKAKKIEDYEKSGDYTNYTIFVHGLKSSARAIGAMKLSEMAAMLERCGNERKIDEIKKWTPVLLESYRSYKGQIGPAVSEEEDEELPEIPETELINALGSIAEFVEASYFDSADDIMKMLSGYKIPQNYKEKISTLKKLMSEVDRDGIIDLLQSIRE